MKKELITKIIKERYGDEEIGAIDCFRDMITFFNNRDEDLNCNKTFFELINDYFDDLYRGYEV